MNSFYSKGSPLVSRGCECAEGYIWKGGLRRRVVNKHDCQYVRRRNKLIPQAKELADKAVELGDKNWPRSFFYAMDMLWSVANNRVKTSQFSWREEK